ncbi:hypothetical protein N7335_02050 [Stutzerimonas stutzeri]|uniref:Uncharacterized protein n=1 Tax=Stutzerimonas stutzeri TaxID=316 RepID=A0AA42KRI4_STUST|nr:hypothetical protein [Stutzerimonas stutzeri]MDH0145169.1 hypothetical protein [Stutzerimonas stutzeri]MDH0149576.1 hypothetical protein [Stutzerimonas stutzeri]
MKQALLIQGYHSFLDRFVHVDDIRRGSFYDVATMKTIEFDPDKLEGNDLRTYKKVTQELFDWSDYSGVDVEEILDFVCSGFTRYGYPVSPIILSLVDHICELNDDIQNFRDISCINNRKLEIASDIDALTDAYIRLINK